MSTEIEKVRRAQELLAELEKDLDHTEDTLSPKNFDALEVPQLVASIVDFLQPQLTTYEAPIYWHLFRHSVLSTGQQHARASVRGLMAGVVTSSSGQSEDLSYRAVQRALQGLESKGRSSEQAKPIVRELSTRYACLKKYPHVGRA